jgi:hypothetical protein
MDILLSVPPSVILQKLPAIPSLSTRVQYALLPLESL